MSKMLFVDIGNEWAISILKKKLCGSGHELFFDERPLEEALAALKDEKKLIEVLSVFITSHVGSEQLKELPGLKLITTRSTGFDHIDLDAARERGVLICNVPVYGDNTVAEHTLALILSLSRNLRKTYERVRRDDFNPVDLEGFDLRKRTLGVVGTGHIGLRVIQIARGFNMRVIASDPLEQPLLADILGFNYLSFEELLAESDIVTLHAPLNPHTRHMINAETLALMKPKALLINTARGGLVDTDALVEALHSGHLGGAGLDVLEHESMLLDEDHALAGLHDTKNLRTTLLNHLLLNRENVVFTPHLAFNSHEANERIIQITIDSIRGYVEGTPRNTVSQ